MTQLIALIKWVKILTFNYQTQVICFLLSAPFNKFAVFFLAKFLILHMQLLIDVNHRKQSHFGPSKFCKTRKAYNEKKRPRNSFILQLKTSPLKLNLKLKKSIRSSAQSKANRKLKRISTLSRTE